MPAAKPPPRPLRAALLVSWASLLWTVASGAAAIALGLAAASPALLAFGAVALLDGLGSAVLVLHFRHALRHAAISEKHERHVSRVVSAGLAVTGLATIGFSAYRLAHHSASAATATGIELTAASCIVLAMLARRKVRVAGVVGSRALRSDGWVSATGAALSAVALAGTGLNAALGLRWIDAVAAIVVATGAVGLSLALAAATWMSTPGS